MNTREIYTSGSGKMADSTKTDSTEPYVADTDLTDERAEAKPTQRWRSLLLAAVSGLCMAAALPPWGWWPAAFVGFALLDYLIANQGWRRRFAVTWVAAAFWLYPAMLFLWDLTPGYVIAGGFYAFYYALAAAICTGGSKRRFALPGLFAFAEFARWSWPFGGVPLANLALGQVDSPLAVTARLGTALLIVVLVVVGGQALHSIVRRDAIASLVSTAVVIFVVLLAHAYPRAKVVNEVEIAAVQGGGAQQTRAASNREPVVLARHLEATKQISQPVDLVLWPENVVNPGKYMDQTEAFDLVSEAAADADAEILAGWFRPISDTETVNYHSVITPDGKETDRYDKVRLVPFGEFVPLRGVVERFGVDDLPGRDVVVGQTDPVLDTTHGPVGVSISWESFFDNRARASVNNGAQLLTNPTNGASYWLTQVQTQQVASNQLRAIENDRWVVQAAPTGFSAIISPDGEVLQRTSISERATLVATVQMRSGRTPATRFGHWPVATFGAAALVLSLNRVRQNWRHSDS